MEIEQKREDSISILIFKNAWSKHGNVTSNSGYSTALSILIIFLLSAAEFILTFYHLKTEDLK